MTLVRKEVNTHFGPREIVDAKHNLSIRLLQEDIDEAIPWDPTACAVARSVKRAFGAHTALIWKTTAYAEREDGLVERFSIPKVLRRRVIDPLDNGDVPELGTYMLKVPTPSNKLGAARQRRERREALSQELQRKGFDVPLPSAKTKKPYQPRPMVSSRLLKVFRDRQ